MVSVRSDMKRYVRTGVDGLSQALEELELRGFVVSAVATHKKRIRKGDTRNLGKELGVDEFEGFV